MTEEDKGTFGVAGAENGAYIKGILAYGVPAVLFGKEAEGLACKGGVAVAAMVVAEDGIALLGKKVAQLL